MVPSARRSTIGGERNDFPVGAACGVGLGVGLRGIIGFILWIAVMVWVYNLAKRKGRHPILWTILAFFFWLLALVLLLLLPSKRTTPLLSAPAPCARRAGCAALRLGQRTVACSAPMSVTAKTAAYRLVRPPVPRPFWT